MLDFTTGWRRTVPGLVLITIVFFIWDLMAGKLWYWILFDSLVPALIAFAIIYVILRIFGEA